MRHYCVMLGALALVAGLIGDFVLCLIFIASAAALAALPGGLGR
jgi:hypothetical protein